MGTARILIVDDELIVRESLGGWLERDGHEVDTAQSGEEALEKMKDTRFDILLVDIKMEGMSGLDLLKAVKETDPDVAVVMITAYGSISTAIEAMKNGAYEYLLKPFDPNELGVLIEKIIEHQAQALETQFLREQYKERSRFESMIGQSRALQEIFSLIEDIAPTESTVLITGETGTGKGLAAKAIHSKSPRHEGPFVVVNCGAFPEHLLESELFGYQKGAFTDAKTTKKGRLELAHGGTLFLDEIGEISMRMQIDLLRVLEDRVFYRLGGTQPIEADFRVIAATNKNLEKAIKEGSFREDFYYRLNVISFSMPPLRDHKEDIPLLAEHFLHRFARETNKPVDQISREAMDEMMLYEWPGNVRELENAIERAVVVCKGRKIMPKDLPIFQPEYAALPSDKSLKEVERAHLISVLNENEWNIAKSAKVLGIDRSTLYNKIKRHNISRPS
ncbi:MAG: sigma-54-dependent Fis family transcriptional regulator [Deltaproteobacteria bacterium]|nr:sigma-54-dependent Fis family transcriptional regulator [Deltaproteobacteria bacterium]MBW1920402.1 sigma-54-dependent Fis family transcriptional regulator [Deltaproteobacteria bacterium]MBW1935893.1 sigma-54-dependent Fis family transcriptional regulator [Deltaproteobacteria bacterium]MBW1979008.1 sigma-54-dependent Fis family transcriptional regulator [Deltaproteobacteria bacterium]MBW2045623.1 sigma-54-dependent Fis family transcriptional regulator [Deltaproteobacteria bacterium]